MAEDAFQADAVQVEDRLHDLARLCPRRGVGEPLDALEEGVEPLEPRLELAGVEGIRHRFLPSRVRRDRHFCMPNIGTCFTSSSLPSPMYMWTPQGRHGSKLRTARMMSIPLNLSGPFSSKIGVFCTASS